VLRDAVACLAVLAVVLFLVVQPAVSAMMAGEQFDMRHAGAELGAPADPSKPYSAGTRSYETSPPWHGQTAPMAR